MYSATKWIAEDGTEFDDMDECHEYEMRGLGKTVKGMGIVFFDLDDYEGSIDWRGLPYLSEIAVDAMMQHPDSCYGIFIPTEAAADWYSDQCDEFDELPCPFSYNQESHAGFFVYDSDTEEWIDFEETWARYAEHAQAIFDFINRRRV